MTNVANDTQIHSGKGVWIIRLNSLCYTASPPAANSVQVDNISVHSALLGYHVLSAKFLKYGNKRVGDSDGDPWVAFPKPTAWPAG
jgi:hypothetical protein